MSVFSVGVVGAGSIVGSMHLPVLMSMPQVRVAWIADASAERAAGLARAYQVPRGLGARGPSELPEADVVLLAIPVAPRTPYYEALGPRGTAVFAEKPFALTAADHERFASFYPPERIGCGYMRRMYASTMLLRRLIAEEWFGPLRRMRIAEGGRTTKTGVDSSYQDLTTDEGGGILINLACHSLDLAFWMTEATGYVVESKRVVFDGATDRKAEATICLTGRPGGPEADVPLEFVCSWLDRQDNTITLTFDRAAVVAGTGAGAAVHVRSAGHRENGAQLMAVERGATTSNQAFYLEWREFLRGIEAREPGAMAATTCLATTRLVDELLERRAARAAVGA